MVPYVPGEKTPDLEDDRKILDGPIHEMAEAIAEVASRHGYEAAFAGEFNYTITRLMQQIPRSLISKGIITEEMRYWIMPLLYGILLDTILEHKRRANVPYEAHQIIKSGDCYDTPYYTRLMEVTDKDGNHIGYTEVMLKRSDDTLPKDCVGVFRSL